tara:strand:- start:1444 stop:3090 length:1647 start_codon:yes stop_codon:yes gene_type:complete
MRPVEHSWRSQLCKPVVNRKASNIPEQYTKNGLKSKRKELSDPFAVKKANVNAIGISAKSGSITLPVVSAATIRAEKCSVINKSSHLSQGNTFSNFSNSDNNLIKEGRLEEPLQPKKSENIINGPVPIVSLDHVDLQRENGAVKPIPSRDWNFIQQISQGIDHMREDDNEITEIMDNSSLKAEASSPQQALDHNYNNELNAKEPSISYVLEGSSIQSKVVLDEARQMEMPKEENISNIVANVQSIASEITLNFEDVKKIEDERRELSAVSGASSIIKSQNILKAEKEYINRTQGIDNSISAKSSNFTKHKIPLVDRATYVVDRPAESIIYAQSHTISQNDVPETKRNNESIDNQSGEHMIGNRVHGLQNSKKEEEDDTFVRVENPLSQNLQTLQITSQPTEREEDDIYYSKQYGQGQIYNKPIDSTHIPTYKTEDASFIRTNSMYSSSANPMKALPIPNLKNSGTSEIDRIHAPHSQNWKKNEILMKQETKLSEDRSTPCRLPTPSRNMSSTPMNQTLQVESKRGECTDTRRWTPTIEKLATETQSSR